MAFEAWHAHLCSFHSYPFRLDFWFEIKGFFKKSRDPCGVTAQENLKLMETRYPAFRLWHHHQFLSA